MEQAAKIDPYSVEIAYLAECHAYCTVKAYNEQYDEYLCNFGYLDVWTPAAELSRFSK